MKEVIFNAPYWAILFTASIVIFGLYLRLARYKKRMMQKQVLEKNLPENFFSMNWLAFYARAICLSVSWALLTIALMQPVFKTFITREQAPLPIQYGVNRVDEVLFVVDTSSSMKPFLGRTQEVIGAVIESLGGVNISLISFAQDARMLVAPTEDYLYFQIILNSIGSLEKNAQTANFLTLTEYIQAYLANARYSKSILIVLCTDGQDPAILGRLEPLVLENVRKTTTFSCRWDVVAQGMFQTPQLQFLGQLATKGQGRLYIEKEKPLLSLVDSIVADMAVEDVEKQKILPISLYEEQQAILPLVASFIFILGVLFLPLIKRQKSVQTTVVSLVCAFGFMHENALFCQQSAHEKSVQDKIAQVIDQALIFEQSMRQDIAQDLLQKLLMQKLTVDEKVTVLYDLATLYAKQNDPARALEFFDQIEPNMLERTKKISPMLYASILYNRSVSYVKLAERYLDQGHIEQNQIEGLENFLNMAQEGADELKEVLKEVLLNDETRNDEASLSFSRLTHVYETIAKTKSLRDRLEFLLRLQSQGKQELLKMGTLELEGLLKELFNLQNVESSSNISLYIANFAMAYEYKIRLFIDQLVLFLQAPATPHSAIMRAFLVDSILSSEAMLNEAIAKNDLRMLVQNLFLLTQKVKLVRFEGMQEDVLGILDLRKETCASLKNAPEYLQDFWREAFHAQDAFIRSYIEVKIKHTDLQEGVYLTHLLKRLENEKTMCSRVDEDLLFYKYINMPFSVLYPMLFQTEADFSYLLEKLSASIDAAKLQNIEYEQFEKAKRLLEEAVGQKDRRFYILKSWYSIEPENALLYLSYYIRQEVKGVIPQEDVGFLLQLLDDFSQDQFEEVHKHLQKKFLQKKEYYSESDRFDLYITLFWLTEMLQADESCVKAIARRLDAAIILQQDLSMAFTHAPDVIVWGWYLQRRLVEKIQTLVKKSSMDKALLKKIMALLSQAIKLLQSASLDLAASQQVQKLLLDVKKLLEKEEESTAKQQEERPTTKARELKLEMEKKSLRVTKETSVRLLQELELDDRRLFYQG